ncbi:MAG: hypothetical protein AAGK09_11485 [Planctomycetota bacterium]
MSWLDYEQVPDEQLPLGLDGAAVIWGNVLVRAGAVVWSTTEDGWLVLQTADEVRTGFIWPRVILKTCRQSSLPLGSSFSWGLHEAVIRLDCLLEPDNPARNQLRDLIRAQRQDDDGFWSHVESLMKASATA